MSADPIAEARREMDLQSGVVQVREGQKRSRVMAPVSLALALAGSCAIPAAIQASTAPQHVIEACTAADTVDGNSPDAPFAENGDKTLAGGGEVSPDPVKVVTESGVREVKQQGVVEIDGAEYEVSSYLADKNGKVVAMHSDTKECR